ncbi:hypothetical protein Tco_0377655 [Tanacetum coccineum]
MDPVDPETGSSDIGSIRGQTHEYIRMMKIGSSEATGDTPTCKIQTRWPRREKLRATFFGRGSGNANTSALGGAIPHPLTKKQGCHFHDELAEERQQVRRMHLLGKFRWSQGVAESRAVDK